MQQVNKILQMFFLIKTLQNWSKKTSHYQRTIKPHQFFKVRNQKTDLVFLEYCLKLQILRVFSNILK